ncbi:MAG: hypothetical protein ACOCV8_02150, partial [Spirochaetota bacterium]
MTLSRFIILFKYNTKNLVNHKLKAIFIIFFTIILLISIFLSTTPLYGLSNIKKHNENIAITFQDAEETDTDDSGNEDDEEKVDEEDDNDDDLDELFSDDEEEEEDKSSKEKLKEVLLNLDKNIIIEIANALDIEYEQGASKEEIINKILENIEILVTDKEEEAEQEDVEDDESEQQEEAEQEDDTDRTNIQTPISGENWNIKFDLLFSRTIKVRDREYNLLIIMGNCNVTFEDNKIYSDMFILKRAKDDPSDIEVMAYGDIEIQAGNNKFIAEKAFFYPETFRTILYDVIAYFPPRPFIVKAKIIKLLSGTDEVIGTSVDATTSYLEFPHYKFTGSKLWYYSDNQNIFITNMTFQVGQTTLLYFPFAFQTEFSSGVATDFRYLQGLGFYLQNTFPVNIFNFNNIVHFDYYQKLGLFFEPENDIKLGPLNLSFAVAYDRAVQYIGNIPGRDRESFSNFVDINNDGLELENFNSFRYYIEFNSPLIIYKGEEVDLEKYLEEKGNLEILDKLSEDEINSLESYIKSFIANLSVRSNLSFYKISDPNFDSQFLSFPRKTTFDLGDTIDYNETAYSYHRGSIPTVPGTGGNSMSVQSSINASSSGLSLGISGNWNWSFRSKVGELNPYDVINYYDIQQNNISFPIFNFGINTRLRDNLINDFLYLFYEIFYPEIGFEDVNELVDGLRFTLPLSYSIRFSHRTVTALITDDSTDIKPTEDDLINKNFGEIKSERSNETTTFNYGLPLSISYNSLISFRSTMSYNLIYESQITKTDINKSAD